MVSNVHCRTGFLQFAGKRRKHAVRTRDGITALQQETGDCGKSAAPDADEVNFSHSVLDEYHNNKNETDQDSKINARFAQQVGRHPVHQSLDLCQHISSRGADDA